ncbi:MAG: putative DNA-binding domain-containing protein, partial [Ignavibacteria bacterium]|nr:putative DNA-binding domain-containing protein [Ignavibacteria bacterium]
KNYLLEDTAVQQSRLANYCRTGVLEPIKGVTENRVGNYRRLVYNVIDDTLQTAFPLTHNLLSEEEWDETVNRFFSNHACQSTSVWKMPYEFYQSIEGSDPNLKKIYPFLTELLLFEWMEIELYMMEDMRFPETRISGNFESSVIKFNPEFKLMQLGYPVHQKNPNEISDEDKGEYFILMFRDKLSGAIQFVNLSLFYVWLIERIDASQDSLKNILTEGTDLFGLDYPTLLSNSIPFLSELKTKSFILGFKK